MSANREPDGFRLPIHPSLVRPKLTLGAESPLVYMSAAVCSLSFATGDPRGYLLGGLAWTGILFVLRWIAKNVDPIASQTYARYVNYPNFISAQPSIIALTPPSHEMQ